MKKPSRPCRLKSKTRTLQKKIEKALRTLQTFEDLEYDKTPIISIFSEVDKITISMNLIWSDPRDDDFTVLRHPILDLTGCVRGSGEILCISKNYEVLVKKSLLAYYCLCNQIDFTKLDWKKKYQEIDLDIRILKAKEKLKFCAGKK